jgi:hypothetical protein
MFNTYSVFRFVNPTNILLWTSLILFSDSNLKSNIIIHCQLLFQLLSTQSYQLYTCYSTWLFLQNRGWCRQRLWGKNWSRNSKMWHTNTWQDLKAQEKKLVMQRTWWYVCVLVMHSKIHWGASKCRYRINNQEKVRGIKGKTKCWMIYKTMYVRNSKINLRLAG